VHSAKKVTKEATAENDDDYSHNEVECKQAYSSTFGSHEPNHATSTAGSAFGKGKEGLSDVRRDKTSSVHSTADVCEKQRTGLSDTKQATFPSADSLSTTQNGEASPSKRMTTDGAKISADLVRREKTVSSSTNSCSSAPDGETSSVGKTSCADDKHGAGVVELEEAGFITDASYPSALRRKTSPVEFLANADTKELSSGTVKTGKTLLSFQEVLPREEEKTTFDKDQVSTIFNKDETMVFDKAIKRFPDPHMMTFFPGNSDKIFKVQ